MNAAQTDYQFKLASYLDAAAEVPYWDVGNASAYQAAITRIVDAGLSPAEQAKAITSIGFSIAPAFTNLGFESAQSHVAALTNMAPAGAGPEIGVSQGGGAQSWLMGNGLYGLFSFSGSTASYDPTASSIGYDVGTVSFTAGVERNLNEAVSVGLAFGGASATADAAGDLGEIDTTGLSVTAFARSEFGAGGSVQALVGYQDLSFDSRRNVVGEVADGSTDGSQVFGALTLGYMQDFGAFKLGPVGSVEYYDVSVDGFTETGGGAFNLSLNDQSSTTVVTSIGVQGEYLLPGGIDDGRLTGSLGYTSMSNDDLVIETGFQGLPTLTFPVEGMDEDLIDVSLGYERVLSSNASREIVLSAGYDGAFGDTYERHGVQMGVNVKY